MQRKKCATIWTSIFIDFFFRSLEEKLWKWDIFIIFPILFTVHQSVVQRVQSLHLALIFLMAIAIDMVNAMLEKSITIIILRINAIHYPLILRSGAWNKNLHDYNLIWLKVCMKRNKTYISYSFKCWTF